MPRRCVALAHAQALAWLAALLPSGLLDAATQESLALVLNQLDLVLREVPPNI